MGKQKILITEPFAQEAVNLLLEGNLDVVVNIEPAQEELVKIIEGFDSLIVRSKTDVNGDVIRAGKKLSIIGRAGVGVDNIDVEAATRQGVIVMNAPDANTVSTAELAMLFIMALSRNFYRAVHSLRSGKWEKSKLKGRELYQKTLGIVGLGRIGSEVAKRAQSFGMEVVAFDPFVSLSRGKQLNVEMLPFEELLKRADYITLHLSLTDESYHLIGEEEFGKMKPGVRIVNCARGGIIDEQALYKAVKENVVAGCGLDVFEKEPPIDNPLLELDEVIASPHLGASTQEAQKNVSLQMARQVKKGLLEGVMDNAVNYPRMNPEELSRVGPYVEIAEKLGMYQGQVAEGNIEGIEITCTGEIMNYQTNLLTAAFLKGLLGCMLPESVNYINSQVVAKERGIKVTEKSSSQVEDFPSLIKAEVSAGGGKNSIAGTLFGRNDPRIVRIDGYHVDVSPSGYLLSCVNSDKPGAVAHISSVLNEAGVNIANMTVGRKEAGGRAVTVLNIDSRVDREVLSKIRDNPVIVKALLIKL